MPIRDFASTRLFVRAPLETGAAVELDSKQANYLVNVLRLSAGEEVLVFNGRDGEWRAVLRQAGRRNWQLEVAAQTRPQPAPPDLHLLFAPLKQARHDYVIEKAVEMGVGRLRPVATRHGQISRLNPVRMEANAIEAAEQCGILTLPVIDALAPLDALIGGWAARENGRRIVFCDEARSESGPVAALSAMPQAALAVLIARRAGLPRRARDAARSALRLAISLGPHPPR